MSKRKRDGGENFDWKTIADNNRAYAKKRKRDAVKDGCKVEKKTVSYSVRKFYY
jgi:N-acetyl-anhydromuramyl-L-alanine amidase AmpD